MSVRTFLAASIFMLAGCAAQSVQIRELPPETPAADNAAAIEKAAALSQTARTEVNPATQNTPPVTPAEAPSMYTYDPWERFNRFTYRFNARFDERIFLPVANTYRRLPTPVRAGTHNFFGNLSEVDSMINFALQGRMGLGGRSLARFAINTTIGIAGLFDVANEFDLPPAPTGFATTLAKWGMHPGPFLVLPFFGPSTLRDGLGLAGDFGTSYIVDMGGLYRTSQNSWMLGVAKGVDDRSSIGFRYYATGSAFEYETIRFLYVRKRLIEDEGLHADEQPAPRDVHAPAGQ